MVKRSSLANKQDVLPVAAVVVYDQCSNVSGLHVLLSQYSLSPTSWSTTQITFNALVHVHGIVYTNM